jgi:AraC-like DNA-binding protein
MPARHDQERRSESKGEMMGNSDPTGFDNLSKLTNELKEIEGREGGVKDPARADEVREGLVAAMRGFVKSLYHFAEQLDCYHKLFKVKKTATAAMERIATERGCSSRTLYRLLKNFNSSKQLSLFVMDEMREQGIDPVLTRHQALVGTLTEAPEPANREEAKASLTTARAKVLKIPSVARKARTAPSAQAAQTTKATEATDSTGTDQIADVEIDEFATRIVRMFEERFGAYRGEDRDAQIRSVLERVVNSLGADVRELCIDHRPECVRKPAKSKP